MLFPSFFLFALLAIEAKAVTVLANFVRTSSNLLQTAPYLYLRVERAHSSEITVKEHIILGIDERDAEEQRDLWLSENPAIKVLRVHRPTREPQWLTRLGTRNVPRVSTTVDYKDPDVNTD
jgi:hypothetical protein